MKRYGILDDFGSVIRWQNYQPSDVYKFIIEKIKRPSIKEILADCEEAPF